MPVRVTCPTCETRFDAASTARGAAVKCPNCGDFAKVPRKKSAADDGDEAASNAKWIIGGVIAAVTVCTVGVVALIVLLKPAARPAPAPAPPQAAAAPPAKRPDPSEGFVWLEDGEFGFAVQVPKGYVATATKVPQGGASVMYIGLHAATKLNVVVKAYRFAGWNEMDAGVYEKFLFGYEGLSKPAGRAATKLAGLDGFDFEYSSGGTGGLADLLGQGGDPAGGEIPSLDDPKFLDKIEENLKKQKDSLEKAKDVLKGGIRKQRSTQVRVAAGPGKTVYLVRVDADGDKPDPFVWAVVTGSFTLTR